MEASAASPLPTSSSWRASAAPTSTGTSTKPATASAASSKPRGEQNLEGELIVEGGPDGWVSEKPWARELAIELGLESELIYSNDATRKTYILLDGKLQPIPDGMRMMVPEDLTTLDNSPLFSDSAKQAYANELARAEELKARVLMQDESVADFVRRHFGDEVLNTLAAPLLSGVFGGDVHKLSVRAVMPQFVAMEREHGSLISALQSRSKERAHAPQPIFTSLRRGVGALIDVLEAELPTDRIHIGSAISGVSIDSDEWFLEPEMKSERSKCRDAFDHKVRLCQCPLTSCDSSASRFSTTCCGRALDSLSALALRSPALPSWWRWHGRLKQQSGSLVPGGFGLPRSSSVPVGAASCLHVR